MAQNVQILNIDRQPLRIGHTHIPVYKPGDTSGGGSSNATIITLDVDDATHGGEIRRDLRRFRDRYLIVGTT